ncbi:hypothetical protein CFP65_4676 [Kitasatospora sp. MMS16-BH015]|uniref:hypothetical protein n=1 Tax=Kitasatospora sp. MMS16-BH015 TaxID=2018025 RepID=UPI000CA3D9E3|nr:hypothetical protein [Kitasatospora sp. MMS16-BH015]AUG79404.1 hypothetical protein CFP65_4676 [Kitasatospora sp. MMS16-BH015]
MARSFKEFWARFKAENGLGKRSAETVYAENLRRQAPPDLNLAKHYIPSSGAGNGAGFGR